MTYRKLAERIRRFASAITTNFGFGKGDVLAIMAPNCIEWIVAFYGAILAGLQGQTRSDDLADLTALLI